MSSQPGVKRPHPDSSNDTRPKVRRKLHHVQPRPHHIELAPQDPVFAQGQLLRSIAAALAMVGFDGVKPTALEMFRSHVEEYMLEFLHDIRTSMHTSRRTTPTPQDFVFALAHSPNASTASLLQPQLRLALPDDVSCPQIPEPDKDGVAPLDFSALLAPLVDTSTPAYIPQHFPKLPPKHAWRHTDVYPEREKDARRMREKATEEGIMAEQALRKLAAAAKVGAAKTEMRRLSTLSGPGRKLQDVIKATQRGGRGVRPAWQAEEMFGEMMKEVVGGLDQDEDRALELGEDGTKDLRQQGVDVGMPEGVLVNADMNGWRRGGRQGVRV